MKKIIDKITYPPFIWEVIIPTLFKIAIIIFIIIPIITNMASPLRKSPEKVEKDILKITPIGMDMEDVINVLNNKKGWQIDFISYDHGYIERLNSLSTKTVNADLGKYSNLLYETYVEAFWGFDDNFKLIEVYVRKDGGL